ncbi:hypothetical protein MB46_18655 [Arthrobacter alpinus]|uniref:hypothetical protein n=1 Tax=Arthrobacter alpinus TaxID=656366 RepID=UPI0005CA9FA4|nr:hypothetical protein [Arthrobacter alpinus]ALV47213.1 hypothetical protein MB46_18655 [Arthrobacter alpinus]
MTSPKEYDPTNRAQVFDILRRQILSARLTATLDKKQNRVSTPTVVRLSMMPLPPIVEPYDYVSDVRTDAVAQKAADIRSGRRPTVPVEEVRRYLDLEG